MVLTGIESPLQAGLTHITPAADLLGLRNLHQGRAGVPDREEQLWVLVTACRLVAPVHVSSSFLHPDRGALTTVPADVRAGSSAHLTLRYASDGCGVCPHLVLTVLKGRRRSALSQGFCPAWDDFRLSRTSHSGTQRPPSAHNPLFRDGAHAESPTTWAFSGFVSRRCAVRGACT